MDNMKKANEAGKFINYKFGYSNFADANAIRRDNRRFKPEQKKVDSTGSFLPVAPSTPQREDYRFMEGIMASIILINGIVTGIITWIFILIRKHALKKNVNKFDINIVVLMVSVASEVDYIFKNNSNMFEILVKCIIQFLFLILYIYVSMRLFRKANSLKGE